MRRNRFVVGLTRNFAGKGWNIEGFQDNDYIFTVFVIGLQNLLSMSTKCHKFIVYRKRRKSKEKYL